MSDSLRLHELQHASPLDCKEIQSVHPRGDQSWVFSGRTDAEAETPVLWPPHAKSWLVGKDPDAGRDLGVGGEGDDRGWDGWMASPTWWAWVWVSSGSWWWTGRPGMLRFMGSQRVGHNWATELTDWMRPPCPSQTPGVYSNPCPSSRWCHPAISSSVIPFSPCPQSLPASESFPISLLFTWGG